MGEKANDTGDTVATEAAAIVTSSSGPGGDVSSSGAATVESVSSEQQQLTPRAAVAAASTSSGAAAVVPAAAAAAPTINVVPAKHPLYHNWTLWYDAGARGGGGGGGGGGGRQATWGSSLHPVYSFGSVEDFWCMYNNIKPPSDLKKGSDLHVFKRNVEPKWEDPTCEKGGKWTIQSPGKQGLDVYWLNTLLALIGEQFDEGDDICGVVVNIREKDRISLWTSTAHNEARQCSIAKQWKHILDVSSSVGFLSHEDVKSSKRSKELYWV